jgi:acyl carrier protein
MWRFARVVTPLEPRDLIATLATQVPGYMVPPTMVVIDELPRLPNMKIDRVRLARMDAERIAKVANGRDDAMVGEVARVFERVLDVADVTADDNVGSLGGDSLQALRVAAALENRFGIVLPPQVFQMSETIGDLAQWIVTQQQSGRAARSSPGGCVPPP